jgi:hypothetical protein
MCSPSAAGFKVKDHRKAGNLGEESKVANRRIYRGLMAAAGAAGLAMIAGMAPLPAAAAERGGINLGNTSFFDGLASRAPGCTYLQYIGHNDFKSYNGADGNKTASVDLNVTYFSQQLACNTDVKFLGGVLGWSAAVPIAGKTFSSDQLPYSGFASSGAGLGDVKAGPYILFPPVMSNGRPVFAQGFEFDVIAPTGKFDEGKTFNPGNDYWSINPFWRATWLPAPQWEVSWRAHYIHNFDHTVNAHKLLNGDGVWVNFTASRELFKDFYLGLNGYWLKQLNGDRTDGVERPGTRQESLYIGPGFHYTLDPKNIINLNVYLPVTDVNAYSSGTQVNLMYIHPLN